MVPSPVLRVYLAGDLCIERGTTLVRASRLPGPQGRVLFAMLAATDDPLPNDAIVDELWGATPPAAADVAIRALISKIRRGLVEVRADVVDHEHGGYRWRPPTGTWIDVRAAADAIHRAESSATADDLDGAIAWGRVAASIASRPLLVGAEGPWVTARRRDLSAIYLRALEHLGSTWLAVGAKEQAARDALRAVSLDPFREPSRRLAMRALATCGDRAGALRLYEDLRRLLAGSLGADPSPETQALHVAILRGDPL